MKKGLAIDLGTTYSRVAVWQYGQVEVIANHQGNRNTPSYVAYSDDEWLCGSAAKNQVHLNPTNTVYDIKRFIGRRYEDPEIQEDMKLWPFKIINVCGKIMIEAQSKGRMRVYTAEEICAVLLTKLRETAESYLGVPCANVVITVPAYFSELQRECIKFAGEYHAGLKVMRIINEPVAAAFTYSLHKGLRDKQNIFIFDLGGGTFDVSVLTVDEGSHFEVLAKAGDAHLGGEDFDSRLVNYIIKEIGRKNNKDISDNCRAIQRIKFAAERAKRNLSSTTEAVIELDALFDGVDVYLKVTRAKFEALCVDLFQRITVAVSNVLVDAKLDRNKIQEVLLVGGATRMPKVRQLLQKFFCERILNYSLNPEEAVVSGAAIQAALLCGEKDERIQDFLLTDIAPLSLGIETAGGLMTVIVQRGTKIPCQETRIFTTFTDQQSTVTIQVFEGERMFTKHNHHLDTITLSGIPLLPRGIPKIEVTFDVDVDGILHVEGKETSTGISHQIKIEKKNCDSHRDIKKILSEADKHKEEDGKLRQRIEAKYKLEKYVHQVKQAVIDFRDRLNDSDVKRIHVECVNCLVWLRKNANAALEEYEEKYVQLLQLCNQCGSSISSP